MLQEEHLPKHFVYFELDLEGVFVFEKCKCMAEFSEENFN